MAKTETILQPFAVNSGSGYTKLPDGTLIQWGKIVNIAKAINIPIGAIYRSEPYVLTFPIAFADDNISTAISYQYHTGIPYSINAAYNAVYADHLNLFLMDVQERDDQARGRMNWLAIGRWK